MGLLEGGMIMPCLAEDHGPIWHFFGCAVGTLGVCMYRAQKKKDKEKMFENFK